MEPLEPLECCAPLAREPIDPGRAATVARVFKALGDPVRLRILSIVASHASGEACVCDLTAAFDLSQPTISHHLKVLKDVGLLTSERRASWVYYRVVPERLAELSGLLAAPAAMTEH
ncbi:ArsR/SmtB family transcription factor [Planomonospora parontospora]|uniref:ArsR/SmtB family transcription factor n=1 Tax=Planomonospora parontospora TaxID=58119 RepID=UPI00166FED97|nr:metalloregulator ArsR/SmtB family transcription factor [Planomonospora parontospora]GGL43193.1 putative transcriptional regulator, ArsR family protein [Planomonospora parontospora subsp. antibiotica]GII18509.1 putative transcriptional regulator, ArsR family protein [Planomonospora parontospora subsp. antibiotica]